jgi:hypothetical protein
LLVVVEELVLFLVVLIMEQVVAAVLVDIELVLEWLRLVFILLPLVVVVLEKDPLMVQRLMDLLQLVF